MQSLTHLIEVYRRLWAEMVSGDMVKCEPVIPLTGALRQKTLLSGSLQWSGHCKALYFASQACSSAYK